MIGYIHSGELAERFHHRNMKLPIGEVEHEEIMHRIGAPSKHEGLITGLHNYYSSSVAQALVERCTNPHVHVADMFTAIVTDVRQRGRSLKVLGVASEDVMR